MQEQPAVDVWLTSEFPSTIHRIGRDRHGPPKVRIRPRTIRKHCGLGGHIVTPVRHMFCRGHGRGCTESFQFHGCRSCHTLQSSMLHSARRGTRDERDTRYVPGSIVLPLSFRLMIWLSIGSRRENSGSRESRRQSRVISQR